MNSKNDTTQGERVAKVMARAGLCSRREAEDWIRAGRVAVNGDTITSPALDVTAEDAIEVDGQPLPQRERTRLFRYHKPRGLVTTNSDPQGRRTIFEELPNGLPRLISIGRLDLASEGLLLLTNDGGLARTLELPDTGWVRRYRVRAHGHVTQEMLDTMRDGITVEGIHYGPVEATLDHAPGANKWLTVSIREGKNREVRNVLGAIGLDVNRLLRVSFGPFELADLPEGAIDEIPTGLLRQALGEDVIKESGADFEGPLLGRTSLRMEVPRRKWRDEREDRGSRDDRRSRGGRGDRDERGPRRERGERSFDDRGERRGFGKRGRRDRDGEPEAEAPKKRITKHHGDTRVWRGGDAPLRRKFHGARSERHEEEKPSGPKRAGMVADRKGRQVLVERFGDPKPEEDAPRRWRDDRGRAGRAGGDRPRARRGKDSERSGGDRRGRSFGADEPRGDKTTAGRFRGKDDRPSRFRDDKPRGERPRSERTGRDRPREDRPRDERPRSERPRGKPGGRKSFDRRPPRRDRSSGPRPSRPKD